MKEKKNCFVIIQEKDKEKIGYLDYSRNIIIYQNGEYDFLDLIESLECFSPDECIYIKAKYNDFTHCFNDCKKENISWKR